jgi:hypothetical protein
MPAFLLFHCFNVFHYGRKFWVLTLFAMLNRLLYESPLCRIAENCDSLLCSIAGIRNSPLCGVRYRFLRNRKQICKPFRMITMTQEGFIRDKNLVPKISIDCPLE